MHADLFRVADLATGYKSTPSINPGFIRNGHRDPISRAYVPILDWGVNFRCFCGAGTKYPEDCCVISILFSLDVYMQTLCFYLLIMPLYGYKTWINHVRVLKSVSCIAKWSSKFFLEFLTAKWTKHSIYTWPLDNIYFLKLYTVQEKRVYNLKYLTDNDVIQVKPYLPCLQLACYLCSRALK